MVGRWGIVLHFIKACCATKDAITFAIKVIEIDMKLLSMYKNTCARYKCFWAKHAEKRKHAIFWYMFIYILYIQHLKMNTREENILV